MFSKFTNELFLCINTLFAIGLISSDILCWITSSNTNWRQDTFSIASNPEEPQPWKRSRSSKQTVEMDVAATAVPTVISEVTAPDVAPEISDHDLSLFCASEKKSARKKTWEERGRKRPRGGQNKAYYQKWAGKDPSYGWKKQAALRPLCLYERPLWAAKFLKKKSN